MKKYSKKTKIDEGLISIPLDEKSAKRQSVLKIMNKALSLVAATTIAYTSLKCGSFFHAQQNGMLNFEERSYTVNVSVEQGYYNQHPIRICISNQFSELGQTLIIQGIKYLDKNADGIRFEYFVGNPSTSECDIKICRTTYNSSTQSGQATLGNLDAKQIKGRVLIDENIDTLPSLNAIAVHEICHVIGLNHSKDVNSMMFPIITTSKLSKQDIKNINDLYPSK